jgi:type II secretory pathway predicted ATPase ExeA
MVLDYYNLREQPFGVTADPRFLYLSPTHREALASLCYGIKSGRGFMSLIAKPGMGKTTILFQLLDQLKDSARTVYLFQTLCQPEDLLRGLLRDLGVSDDSGDVVHMQDQLNQVLLSEARQRRKVIVVIDEAQNLQDSALELLRMLSNFETSSDKLMQIVLGGQPQLRDKLALPHLLQLRQRMSIFARLHPFNREETHLYIENRLRVAGYNFERPLFTSSAQALIAKYSEGIPRNINNICFNALSLGWVQKQKTIEKEVVREVLNDLDLTSEGNTDLAQTPSARISRGWGEIGRNPFQQAFSWRKQLALFAILLSPLMLTTVGRQEPPANDSRSLVSSFTTPALDSTRSLDLPGLAQSANVEPKLEPESEPAKPREEVNLTLAKLERKPQQQLPADSEKTPDPSTLWAKVKTGNSDAAVDLARLYLQSAGVPQNCAQAQVLLLTASREGNARATDLLNDSNSQCH